MDEMGGARFLKTTVPDAEQREILNLLEGTM
jgi:hypothetical protein